MKIINYDLLNFQRKYKLVLKQLINKKYLKEILISLDKLNVLLQCKFDRYSAQYINDIINYNILLPQKIKYNKVIQELKYRMIYFYFEYNTTFKKNKLKYIIFPPFNINKYYQKAIADYDTKLGNDMYYDINYTLFIQYIKFSKDIYYKKLINK